ncbi:MAG: hypothetical protein HC806_02860 [Anaerolineae bacterium]|nr:hypothetical protein [Anaerolineae bacterium]
MVGSASACLEAAAKAARQALTNIGAARPILAIVFADIAWKMLFETQPGGEIAPIREIFGPEIPIAGGYTVGQIHKSESGIELLNQHIEIMLLGAID